MSALARLFRRDSAAPAYEAIEGGSETPEGERIEHSGNQVFSWVDYSIFVLLGVSMLWAWNMFLAAAPYFQQRFGTSETLLRNFQSAELSVATVGNLGSMIVLTKLQSNASYPKRIMSSLAINVIVFGLLAVSTGIAATAAGYFVFFLFAVFTASLATGLCQNGVFAYASGFGLEEYTQAIMIGQGMAGVLPCIAQIISVLSVAGNGTPNESTKNRHTAALVYFMTAVAISFATLLAFLYLLTRESSNTRLKKGFQSARTEDFLEGVDVEPRPSIPLWHLFRKLVFLSSAVFLTFAVTMMFPVFTQKIHSVRDSATAPRIFRSSCFIPLAFLFWNVGDLIGRVLPAAPALNLTSKPRTLFALSIARLIFIPLYLFCNLDGRGAIIHSDFFYLFVVQLGFGISNGYLGSNCMMGFVEYVDADEREAAGGFMSLSLVAGLTAGSFVSFAAGAA